MWFYDGTLVVWVLDVYKLTFTLDTTHSSFFAKGCDVFSANLKTVEHMPCRRLRIGTVLPPATTTCMDLAGKGFIFT